MCVYEKLHLYARKLYRVSSFISLHNNIYYRFVYPFVSVVMWYGMWNMYTVPYRWMVGGWCVDMTRDVYLLTLRGGSDEWMDE